MSRDYCSKCTRPIAECYCDSIVAIENPIKVLIIQHPLESKHPYNTGRIANMALQNSELIIGETLSPQRLSELSQTNSALLFPELSWLGDATAMATEVEQLIVIDATWRKAKRILHLNPLLQNLPRVSLSGTQKSEYQIRTSSIDDGLSTIESLMFGLAQLDETTNYQVLKQPFARMVALAKRYIPDS